LAASPVKGPGDSVIPIIQRMKKVDLRVIVLDVPNRTSSRATTFREGQCGGLFPDRRPGQGHHPGGQSPEATSQFAQTTLRSALGQHELDRCRRSVKASSISTDEATDMVTR
jgi:hypothetical protein